MIILLINHQKNIESKFAITMDFLNLNNQIKSRCNVTMGIPNIMSCKAVFQRTSKS